MFNCTPESALMQYSSLSVCILLQIIPIRRLYELFAEIPAHLRSGFAIIAR